MQHESSVPVGYCQCGCGGKTKIAKMTYRSRGVVAGQPNRFLTGHHTRKGPDHYRVEDCGHDTPCWVWQRYINPAGYGKWALPGHRGQLAHRIFYEVHVGPIPEGHNIDHLCRNRACVNPDHLEAVTQAVNARRGAGAKLTVEQVREIRALEGSGRTGSSIAREYGVTLPAIVSIWRRWTWREVT